MPFRFAVVPERSRVEVELQGAPTVAEFRRLTADVTSHAAYDRTLGWLIDARDLTTPASAEQVHELVAHLERIADRLAGRIAVVVEGPVHLGVARMIAIQADDVGLDVGVFQSMEQATDWLAESGSIAGRE